MDDISNVVRSPEGPEAVVWTRGNRFSSGESTQIVKLKGLPSGATELCGSYVCVDGQTKLNGKFKCNPFQTNKLITEDCFDQGLVYHTLDSYIRFLGDDEYGPGFDMRFTRVWTRGSHRPIPVHVNVLGFENAIYFTLGEDISLGDGNGNFHFASDGDIVVHEASHWVIDLINPWLNHGSFFGAGQAIHEGCADILTALYFEDPQIGEDYGYFMRRGRGSEKGLRSVQNSRTFGNVHSLDPHQVGKIYSGFFWSLFGRLQEGPFNLSPRDARRTVTTLVLMHLGHYQVESPDHTDFVDAVLTAAKFLVRGRVIPTGYDPLKDVIMEEAKARGFLDLKGSSGGTAAPTASLSFGPPKPLSSVGLSVIGGAIAFFRPQLYQTEKHGGVPVIGHGCVERQGERHMKGVRHIEAGSIDETVSITKEDAYKRAIDAVKNDLPKQLADRKGDSAVSPKVIAYAAEMARKVLEKAGSGQLAILSSGNRLIWAFDAGLVFVAINASDGKLATLEFRGMID